MTIAELHNDKEFEEARIAEVEAGEGGWTIKQDGGLCFWCPDNGVEPKVGDIARFYGRGFGFTVRGLTINGAVVFYRTPEQQEAHDAMQQATRNQKDRETFERNRADHDERIARLPRPLRERLERYAAADPDFRWKYEGYELFVCEQAAAIAENVPRGEIKAFHEAAWKSPEWKAPEWLDTDNHSGNTFGAACSLAARLQASEESVAAMSAAIAPLVGQKGNKVG